jgi:phosphomevalonate kinase
MRTAASAPGKVLLSGGYLVVDRAHTGLVFGLSARIHVVVEDLDPPAYTSNTNTNSVEVLVKSPQFDGAEWQYECSQADEGRGVRVKQR